MDFLVRHIRKTADIAAGYKVGTLVIEDGQAYMQPENGTIIPVTGMVEVKNGDIWQHLTTEDINAVTADGWPAYAGLDARMM